MPKPAIAPGKRRREARRTAPPTAGSALRPGSVASTSDGAAKASHSASAKNSGAEGCGLSRAPNAATTAPSTTPPRTLAIRRLASTDSRLWARSRSRPTAREAANSPARASAIAGRQATSAASAESLGLFRSSSPSAAAAAPPSREHQQRREPRAPRRARRGHREGGAGEGEQARRRRGGGDFLHQRRVRPTAERVARGVEPVGAAAAKARRTDPIVISPAAALAASVQTRLRKPPGASDSTSARGA